MFRKLIVIMMASFVFFHAQTLALGLGDIELSSGLNQPFNATIKLVSNKKSELEGLRVGLASNADFDRIGAVRLPFLNGLDFEIVIPDNGKPYIKVTSNQPIREPFVDFIMEANWPAGRLLREYTVLLDPPTLTAERATPVQAPSVSRASAAAPAPRTSVPQRQQEPSLAGGIIEPTNTASVVSSSDLVFGPVGANDTLWNIADSMRPDDSVSVQQMMIALLKENPDAFGDNNINNLKRGKTLRIEDQAVITELSHRQAVNETSRQYQSWLAANQARRAARGEVAKQEAIATPAETAGDEDASKQTVDSESDIAPEGGLRLLADDALEDDAAEGGVTDVAGVDSEIEKLREEMELTTFAAKAAREKNAELSERMLEFEEQIAAMQRALKLKNDDIARLQQKLSESSDDDTNIGEMADAGAIETLPLVPAEEAEIVGELVDADAESGSAAANEGEPESLIIEHDSEEVDSAEADGARMIDNVVKNAADIGSSITEKVSGFFSDVSLDSIKQALQPETILERYRDNPLIFRIVGGIIVLLIVLGLIVRRRRVAAEEQFEELTAPHTAADAEVEEEPVDKLDGGATADDMEDALHEADVYISYQRYDKAETILKQAIDKEPQRVDLKAKLLEVYHGAKNVPAFIAGVDGYYTALSEDQAVWSKINAMGLELAPDHHLFSSDSASAAEFDSIEGFDELDELDDIDVSDSDDVSEDDYADIDLEMEVLTTDGDVWQEDDSSVEDETADDSEPLALDANDADINEADADDAEKLYEEASKDLENEFDLDLDINIEDDESSHSVELTSESVVVETVAEPEQPELNVASEQESVTLADAESNTEAAAADASASLLERAMDTVADGGEVTDFNEKYGSTNIGDDSLGEPLSTYNLDDDEGAEDYDPTLFSGVDVISTKLDLAKAYIDMGDQEGARSILGEVVAEGNDEQQREAQELIDQL